MLPGRSFPALLLLLVFALLQSVAPLLHAHVQAGGPGVGIHLPDATAVVDHDHSGGSPVALFEAPCGLDEGAMVTAAAEHRRDDAGLPPLETPAVVRTIVDGLVQARPTLERAPRALSHPAGRSAVPPFATGPPLSA